MGNERRSVPVAMYMQVAWLVALWGLTGISAVTRADPPRGEATADDSAEARAVALLTAEVASWQPANGCYSCHNHGDATRALYAATAHGLSVPQEQLAATNRWLARPASWEQNGPEGEFNDLELAQLHFTSALAAGIRAGQIRDRAALAHAAERLAQYQQPDGSWRGDARETVGSPITHGPILATVEAVAALRQADENRYVAQLEKARAWLRDQRPRSVLDAAALLLAFDAEPKVATADAKQQCLELIQRGQSSDGGWGPFVNAPPEPFDTALVVLALATLDDPSSRTLRRAGRKFLVAAQFDDGSWLETTRPPNRESYAHRISTAGWALRALLASRK